MHLLASIDASLLVLPAAARVALWAAFSAAISMGIYARLSPQKKILAIKEEQKEARRALMRHEGDFAALGVLIRRDLSLSLKQIGLAVVPFALSIVPLLFLMAGLMDIYTAPLVAFGPEWLRGFEFWYILILVLASLAIKIAFKIA